MKKCDFADCRENAVIFTKDKAYCRRHWEEANEKVGLQLIIFNRHSNSSKELSY